MLVGRLDNVTNLVALMRALREAHDRAGRCAPIEKAYVLTTGTGSAGVFATGSRGGSPTGAAFSAGLSSALESCGDAKKCLVMAKSFTKARRLFPAHLKDNVERKLCKTNIVASK
jgi:hypothetical protein